MISQNSTEKVHQDIFLEWIDAAKLRTVIKGMSRPPVEFKNRKTRKETRKMSASYYVEQLVKENVRDVKPDAESLKWMNEKRQQYLKRRERQDELVRKGVNRKPRSEWKKPGRVAGKSYPKYDAAMKSVAANKRKAKKSR